MSPTAREVKGPDPSRDKVKRQAGKGRRSRHVLSDGNICEMRSGGRVVHCAVMEIVQTTTALYTTACGLLGTETSLDSVGLYHGNKKQKHVLDHLCHEGLCLPGKTLGHLHHFN